MNIKSRLFSLLSIFLAGCLTLASCSLYNQVVPPANAVVPTSSATPLAMITFKLEVPEPLNPGETVYLVTLDEVTGLAFNQQRYAMTAEDSQHLMVILPFTLSSVIQYRYMRQGSITVQEHISDGRPVRYRLYHVTGPSIVQDVVSRWTDTTFHLPAGRINGTVADPNGHPIPNILVTASGEQALTRADGSFSLEGLPVGTHTLVAYSMDGSTVPFQQNAVVADGSSTPARIILQPAALVTIVFHLRVPANTPAYAPVRLAANLSTLGNTYADLEGGLSTLSERMPTLSLQPDGRYLITLTLPVGTDLHYKYTLGDGLWNAEHNARGDFRLREMIVPDKNTEIEDNVDNWGSAASVTFNASVPAVTPVEDFVSIQFNPGYGWTAPLPMWISGINQWTYTLFGPLNGLQKLNYRYCRNDQCGKADELGTEGPLAVGRQIAISSTDQTTNDLVTAWAWLPPQQAGPAVVPNLEISPRGPDFTAGIGLPAYYHPTWDYAILKSLRNIVNLGANTLLLSPTWTYTRSSIPVLEPVNGPDSPMPELFTTIAQARNQNLSVVLFPTPNFPLLSAQWFQESPRDFPWWVSWFDSYRTFAFNFADTASQTSSKALVLGGNWLKPALPGGRLADGSPSGVPEDAAERWRLLLADIRTRYTGSLGWALSFPEGIANPPPFLDMVDVVYVQWSAGLSTDSKTDEASLYARAAELLDSQLLPFQQRINKPVVLLLSYPSALGAVNGCLPDAQAKCTPLEDLDLNNLDVLNISIDLQGQSALYNAMLQAIGERPWIAGVVSQGYYPAATLQDKSASINGKPASGAVWFWYRKLQGK